MVINVTIVKLVKGTINIKFFLWKGLHYSAIIYYVSQKYPVSGIPFFIAIRFLKWNNYGDIKKFVSLILMLIIENYKL